MEKFCTKCGQKLAENATFCTSCGNKVEAQGQPVPNQSTYTAPNQTTYTTPNQNMYSNPNPNTNTNTNPYGGTPTPNPYGGAPTPNMYGGAPNPNMYPNQNANPNAVSNNSLATALSIVGLVLSILGAWLFGVFLSIPALILGVVSVIMAVNIKKATNNAKGTPAMVCGILAIVFAAVFTIGCMSCTKYGCYGLVGGSCKAASDVEGVYSDYSNWFN